MASNQAMPKVTPLPNGPRLPTGGVGGGMSTSQTKEELLADLRRQLDDSVSDVGSSVDSRGGRRRRRRNNKALATTGGLSAPYTLPRLADTKPVRLQLGLNLDVELELKARLQGDVSLTLLVEKKQTPRPSTELKPDSSGVVEKAELFYMRIGTLRLRQRWIDQELSQSLTVTVAFGLSLGGFVVGFVTSRWLGAVPLPYLSF
ncbi:hypothetical protein QBC33DRAFT_556307 [Phialemonium atrogriseum]|uniref:Uncharacterized protein n=1 Tax=Phialemonium atrogriseum TaxID=1093897 RepID=A0AAJ0FIS4_9PEZI|nr:uncharacterized protein QBC33DRAFT_556307 [Phialemonium atrogriseum]KAK1769886.1 hypothetical protein QBC33DRAFT_556307 [Phialemonium atrogriseum]